MNEVMHRAYISGVGMFVPERIVTNHDLSKLMDTNDEWIRSRSGIETRRWVSGDTTTSDLALEASKKALSHAGLKASDLDAIILATLSPDHDFPGTACFLQTKLGIQGCAALDIRQQCSGFIYASSIADQFIRTGMYQNILVVGAEIHSKGLDLTTAGRDVSVLFGDGAGAVVISRKTAGLKNQGILLSTKLHADGAYAKELWVEAPTQASDVRLSHKMIEEKQIFPKMNGKVVFINAVKRMSEVLTENLKAENLSIEQVDLFLFHQANLRINEAVAKTLNIPEHKIFNTIQKYGNTTAATIPIGMAEAYAEGKLKPGMLVASAAFGSGFTWASMIFRT